jgi:nicotinamidase-related amidase
MLKEENTVALVIDVQEKLLRVMYQKEKLVENLQQLIKGMKVFGIPMIFTEQYPQGLGPTVPEIAQLVPDVQPLAKVCFSCYDDENFVRSLQQSGRKQVLVSGIESHICVYQTASDLIDNGYEVHVVADTISSRTLENKEIAIKKMIHAGAILTSTETVLFELLRIAKGERFKAISQIVK